MSRGPSRKRKTSSPRGKLVNTSFNKPISKGNAIHELILFMEDYKSNIGMYDKSKEIYMFARGKKKT